MFSVIIPLYNKAAYIEKAIHSVLTQTFREYELIVVDDGSKDNSYKLVEGLFGGGGYVQPKGGWQLHTQSNKGVSATRNRAVAMAKYEYIAFLDADDWWGVNYLEEMNRLIKDFPIAALFASSYYSVKYGEDRPAKIGVPENFESGYFDYFKAYVNSPWMPVWTGATILKKSVYLEMDGFSPKLKMGEDFHLWARVALKYKVTLINKPLSFYNQDADVGGRAITKLHKPEEHMLWNLNFLEEAGKSNSNIKQLLDNLRAYSLFPYYLNRGTREKAKQELKKVDWSKQDRKTQWKYKLPIWIVKMERSLKRAGVQARHLIIKGL